MSVKMFYLWTPWKSVPLDICRLHFDTQGPRENPPHAHQIKCMEMLLECSSKKEKYQKKVTKIFINMGMDRKMLVYSKLKFYVALQMCTLQLNVSV